MRVIIIEDKDAKALLDQLELEAMKKGNLLTRCHPDDVADAQTVRDVHRAFHYRVVQWLQDQGCKVTR